jgi:pimeloyl-ACP methyl ester carboxylesterase
VNRPVAGLGAIGLMSIASFLVARTVGRRAIDRLLAGERSLPGEADLASALDDLGGEVVHLRSRDGLRLSARWLPPEARPEASWRPDPRDAIVLLHGWSGSSVPDLVEYGPFLRRTAAILGLDFGGHGGSDAAPTTFGLREVEDVAGALAWLGERGVERVALVGFSMGGIVALAAVAVLGDGSLVGSDVDPAAAANVAPPTRPRIVAVVADSVTPELALAIGSRLPGPRPIFLADRLLDGLSRRLGGDPRETEPIRVIGLLEGTPLLLIAGEADQTVPLEAARRLSEAAPDGTDLLVVGGAGHTLAHATDPVRFESAVTTHLRAAFAPGADPPIIGAPGLRHPDASRTAIPAED